MAADKIDLYGGEIKAHRVGSFVKAGCAFDVIRPGYDSQARRRQSWTQVVHEGVPIYTVKMLSSIEDILERFDELWDLNIGDDANLMARALSMTKNAHVKRFKDGVTGESPAPSISRDGCEQGVQRPA
jgi:hypothetical protein